MLIILAGVVLSLIFCLSLPLNGFIIFVFIKTYHTSKVQDAYIVSLAVSDFLQAMVGYPSEIRSLFTNNPQSLSICRLTGFSVTFLGLVSINHLVFLMIERACVISMPFQTVWKTKRYVSSAIFASWAIGFLCAVAPLVGWSNYTIADAKYLCSIDWEDTTEVGQAYIYFLFASQFLLPLGLIFGCFGVIFYQLKKTNQQIVSTTSTSTSNENRKNMSKWTTMVSWMTTAYIISWTPYAVTSLMTAKNGKSLTMSQGALMAVAITAKSSTLFNPVIYGLMYNDFRNKVKRLFRKWSTEREVKQSIQTSKNNRCSFIKEITI